MTLLRSGSATDTGLVRSVNQDLAVETGTLFAVADGMGGHAGGEVAARLAVDTMTIAFGAKPTGTGLSEAVSEANAVVYEHSMENPELRGMGTTMTAAALVNEDGRDLIALVNVGDSRSYRFHDGELVQITVDHSLAEEMVRTGEITESEAAVHPHRHILTRALGVADEVAVPGGPLPAVQRRPHQRARPAPDHRSPDHRARPPGGGRPPGASGADPRRQ
jgi:serine/threonine protein phosphatase PrpC